MADNDILHPNPPAETPPISLVPAPGSPVPIPEPTPESDEEQDNPLHDAARQHLDQLRQQKIDEVKTKLKGGQQKLQPKAVAGDAAKAGTKEAAEQATKRAAGQVAKQAGKAAAQATKAAAAEVKRVVVAFLADNPVVWVIIAVILVIFIIIAIVIGIFAFSRGNGGGPAIHPTTAAERQQVTKLSALSGNQIANTQLLQQIVDSEKNRLGAAKAIIDKVYPNDAAKATAATNDLTAIITAMDAIPKTPDLATRQKLINDSDAALQKFANNYPEVLGYGAVHGGYLGVPGVAEATKGDCGAASVLMVTLYYNPSYTDDGILDKTAHRSTQGGDVCVSAEYLNAHTPYKDWNRAVKSAANLEQIKKSLAGGDPVIVYGAKGAIFDGSKHIFVVVGYDPSDDTFFVNNPNIGLGNVQVHTKTPNNHPMTSANLSSHLGSSAPDPVGFGHNFSLIIRSKYF